MNDLAREVICLFGLPFDVVTMAEAAHRVREAVRTGERLFLSTPNLNFLIGCQRDAAFRQSVIDSDLSIADGLPLVWMSRWLGIPLPERVAGSCLFERLRDEPPPPGHAPIRVYFFGGPPGIAEAASRQLNAGARGMVCVGYETPGFGSVEEMSDQGVIDRINASQADFLVVALGAVKGQSWIQHNRERLRPPVLSHLGAVVNFTAGAVSRAPVAVQRLGLEWLWRIKEEPALWRRYWSDGLALTRLVFGRLLPHAGWLRRQRRAKVGTDLAVSLAQDGETRRIVLRGSIPDPVPAPLRAVLQQVGEAAGPAAIDLAQVESFGPGFAGLLLLFDKALAAQGRTLQMVGQNRNLQRLASWNGLAWTD